MLHTVLPQLVKWHTGIPHYSLKGQTIIWLIWKLHSELLTSHFLQDLSTLSTEWRRTTYVKMCETQLFSFQEYRVRCRNNLIWEKLNSRLGLLGHSLQIYVDASTTRQKTRQLRQYKNTKANRRMVTTTVEKAGWHGGLRQCYSERTVHTDFPRKQGNDHQPLMAIICL